MKNRISGLWEERRTKEWVWIERRNQRYFSSGWITCVDAVRILKGQKSVPKTNREVKDIAGFEPVSAGVLKLLTKTMERLNENRTHGLNMRVKSY